jgi:probable HAF family extracellular repeat protein
MHDLGVPHGFRQSNANGINEAGDIVGWADTGTMDTSAVIYSNGTWRDLNTLIARGSGWFLSVATGINTSGQIVGTGLHNGAERAFLLTPR